MKIFTRSTISAKDLNWKRLEALDADNRDSDRATVVELMAKARRGLKEPTLGEAVRRPQTDLLALLPGREDLSTLG